MEDSTKSSSAGKVLANSLKSAFRFITSSKAKRYWLLSTLIIFTVSGFIIDVSLFAFSGATTPLSVASSGKEGSGNIPGLTENETSSQPSNQTTTITRPTPAIDTMDIERIDSQQPITEFYGQNITTITHPLFLVDGSPQNTFWRLTAFDRFEKNGTWLKVSNLELNSIDKSIYGGYPTLGVTKKVSVELLIETSPNTLLESYLPLSWAYNESSLIPSSFQFVGDDNNLWNMTDSHSSPYHDYKISILSPYLQELNDTTSATLKIVLKYEVTIPLKPLFDFVPSVVGNYSSIPDWILLHYLQRPSGTTVILLPFISKVQDTNLDYWEQVVALKNNITNTFMFDPDKVPKPRSSIISEMINNPHVAYSSYDIATFTVLAARALNIPARLVMGFKQSVSAENEPQFVGLNDLFFWPEVFIPEYGWLPLNVFSEPRYSIEATNIAGSSDRPFDVWNVSFILNGQQPVPNTVFSIKEIINGDTQLIGYGTTNANGHALLYFNYPDFTNGTHRFLITDLEQRAYRIITVQVPEKTAYQGRLSPDPSIIKYADQYKVTTDPGFVSNGTDGIGWVTWNVSLSANDTDPLNITFQLYLTTEEGNFSNIQVEIFDLSDNAILRTLTYPGTAVTWFIDDTSTMAGGVHSLQVKLSYQSNAFGGRTITFEKVVSNVFNIPRGGNITITTNPSSVLAGYSTRVNMSFYDANGVLITNPNYITDIQVLDENNQIVHQTSSPFTNATYAFTLTTSPSLSPGYHTFIVRAKILGSQVAGSFSIRIIDPFNSPANIDLSIVHNATYFVGYQAYPVIFRGENQLQVNVTLTYSGMPLIDQPITLTDSRNAFDVQARTDSNGNASFLLTFPDTFQEGNLTLTLTYQTNTGSKFWTLNVTVLDPYQIRVTSSSYTAIRDRTSLSFNITLSQHVITPASGTVTVIDLTDNVLIANLSVNAMTTFNYTFPVTSSIGTHELQFTFKTTSTSVNILVSEYNPTIFLVNSTPSGVRGVDNATLVVYISQNQYSWTNPSTLPQEGVNITFSSLTDNVTLGHALTNASGFAEFTFTIPRDWSLGNHILEIRVQASAKNVTLTVEEGFDLALFINGTLHASQPSAYQLFEEKWINITVEVMFVNQPYTNTSNPLVVSLQVNGTNVSQNNNVLTYLQYYDHGQVNLAYNLTFQTTTPAGQILIKTVILTILPHSWTFDFKPNFTPINRNVFTNTTTVYRNATILSWNITVLRDQVPSASLNITVELDGKVLMTFLTDSQGNASFSHWFNATDPIKIYNLTAYLTKTPYIRHVEFINLLQDYSFSFANNNLRVNTTLVITNATLQLEVNMTQFDMVSGRFSRPVNASYWYYYTNGTYTSSNITIISNANLTTAYKHNISITTPTFSNGTYTFFVFANSSTGVLLYDTFTLEVFSVNFTLNPTSLPPQVVDYGDLYSETFTLRLENGSIVPNQVVYFNLTDENGQPITFFTTTTDNQGNLTLNIYTNSTLPQGGKYYFYPYILVTSSQGKTFIAWNGTTLTYTLLVRQMSLTATMSDIITKKALVDGSSIPRNVTILQINYTITLTGLTLQESLTTPILWINDTVDSRLNVAINLTESGLTNSTLFMTYLDSPLGLHVLNLTVPDTKLTKTLQFSLVSKFKFLSVSINGTNAGTITVIQGQKLNASVMIRAFNVTAANQTYLSNPTLTFSNLLSNLTHYNVMSPANGTSQFVLASNQMNVTVTKGNGNNTWIIDPTSFPRGSYSVSTFYFYLTGQNYSATSTTASLTIYIKEPLNLNMTSVPTAVEWNTFWFVTGSVYNPLTNNTIYDPSFTLTLKSVDGGITTSGYPDSNGFFNITTTINDNTTTIRNFTLVLTTNSPYFDVSNAIFNFSVTVEFETKLVTNSPSLVTYRDGEIQNVSWQLTYTHNSTPLSGQKIILQVVELNLNYTSYTNQTGWADFSISWNITEAYRQYTLKAIYEGNSTAGTTKQITGSITTIVQGPIFVRNDYIAAANGNNTLYVIRGQDIMLWGRLFLYNGTKAPYGNSDLIIYAISNATNSQYTTTFDNGFYNITIDSARWNDTTFTGKMVISVTLSVRFPSTALIYIGNSTRATIFSVAQLTANTLLNGISPVSASGETKVANGTSLFFNITLSEINPRQSVDSTTASYITVTASWNGTLLALNRVNGTWNSENVNTGQQEDLIYVLVVNVTSSLSQTYYLNTSFTYTFRTKNALQLVFKNVPTRIQPSQTLSFKVEVHYGGPNGAIYENSTTVNIQVNRTDTNSTIYSQQWTISGGSFLSLSISTPADLKPGGQIIIHGEIISLEEKNSTLAIQATPDRYVDVVQDPSSVSLAVTTPAVTTNGGTKYYYENTTLSLNFSALFPYYSITDFSPSDWSLTFTARDANVGTVLNTTANLHELIFTYTPPPDVGYINLSITLYFQHGATSTTFQRSVAIKIITDVSFSIDSVIDDTGQSQALSTEQGILTARNDKTISIVITATDQLLGETLSNVPLNTTSQVTPSPKNLSIVLPPWISTSGTITLSITLTSTELLENFTITIALSNNTFTFSFKFVIKADTVLTLSLGNNFGSYYLKGSQLYVNLSLLERSLQVPNATQLLNQGAWTLTVDFYLDDQIILSDRITRTNGDPFPSILVHDINENDLPLGKARGLFKVLVQLQWDRAYSTTIERQQAVTLIHDANATLLSHQPSSAQLITQDVVVLKRANGQVLSLTAKVTAKDDPNFALQFINITAKYVNENAITFQSVQTDDSGLFTITIPIDFRTPLGNKSLDIWWQVNNTETVILFNYTIMVQSELFYSKSIIRTKYLETQMDGEELAESQLALISPASSTFDLNDVPYIRFLLTTTDDNNSLLTTSGGFGYYQFTITWEFVNGTKISRTISSLITVTNSGEYILKLNDPLPRTSATIKINVTFVPNSSYQGILLPKTIELASITYYGQLEINYLGRAPGPDYDPNAALNSTTNFTIEALEPIILWFEVRDLGFDITLPANIISPEYELNFTVINPQSHQVTYQAFINDSRLDDSIDGKFQVEYSESSTGPREIHVTMIYNFTTTNQIHAIQSTKKVISFTLAPASISVFNIFSDQQTGDEITVAIMGDTINVTAYVSPLDKHVQPIPFPQVSNPGTVEFAFNTSVLISNTEQVSALATSTKKISDATYAFSLVFTLKSDTNPYTLQVTSRFLVSSELASYGYTNGTTGSATLDVHSNPEITIGSFGLLQKVTFTRTQTTERYNDFSLQATTVVLNSKYGEEYTLSGRLSDGNQALAGFRIEITALNETGTRLFRTVTYSDVNGIFQTDIAVTRNLFPIAGNYTINLKLTDFANPPSLNVTFQVFIPTQIVVYTSPKYVTNGDQVTIVGYLLDDLGNNLTSLTQPKAITINNIPVDITSGKFSYNHTIDGNDANFALSMNYEGHSTLFLDSTSIDLQLARLTDPTIDVVHGPLTMITNQSSQFLAQISVYVSEFSTLSQLEKEYLNNRPIQLTLNGSVLWQGELNGTDFSIKVNIEHLGGNRYSFSVVGGNSVQYQLQSQNGSKTDWQPIEFVFQLLTTTGTPITEFTKSITITPISLNVQVIPIPATMETSFPTISAVVFASFILMWLSFISATSLALEPWIRQYIKQKRQKRPISEIKKELSDLLDSLTTSDEELEEEEGADLASLLEWAIEEEQKEASEDELESLEEFSFELPPIFQELLEMLKLKQYQELIARILEEALDLMRQRYNIYRMSETETIREWERRALTTPVGQQKRAHVELLYDALSEGNYWPKHEWSRQDSVDLFRAFVTLYPDLVDVMALPEEQRRGISIIARVILKMGEVKEKDEFEEYL